MAVRQASSVTLYKSAAVTAVTEYHFKAASTSTAPARPTTKTPPAGWYATVPAWASGTKLYVATRTDLMDGTFLWSAVTEDPTWANAGAAKAKADKTEQYFYADSSGAHVVSGLDSAGKAQGTRLDMDSSGLSIKDAKTLAELASFEASSIKLGNVEDETTVELCGTCLIHGSYDEDGHPASRVGINAEDVNIAGGDRSSFGAASYDEDIDGTDTTWASAWVRADSASGAGPIAGLDISANTHWRSLDDSGSEHAMEESCGEACIYADGKYENHRQEISIDDEGISLWSAKTPKFRHAKTDVSISVGVGDGGSNFGMYCGELGGWGIAWSPNQMFPIIPNLYHGDVGNCSLIPVYTSQKSLGSMKSGASTTGTMSISRSGYSPIGIIGTDTSASTYPGHVLANAWVTSRANGSGTLHYAVKNTTSSSANTIKITWHVLWARQTDINGTYIS